jgi:hypothetical protein
MHENNSHRSKGKNTMTDSYISHGKGGTVFAGADAIRLFTAVTVRSAIGMLKKGIKPSRHWTMTKALRMATSYSGKTYKRTEADRAMADLTLWIDAMRCALPIEKED